LRGKGRGERAPGVIPLGGGDKEKKGSFILRNEVEVGPLNLLNTEERFLLREARPSPVKKWKGKAPESSSTWAPPAVIEKRGLPIAFRQRGGTLFMNRGGGIIAFGSKGSQIKTIHKLPAS